MNDKYKIEGVDSDLTQSLHVQIMENYGNIQIMFDTDWKNLDRYQRIAFNYNLLYAKDVWIHKHLIINQENGITKEFISALDNFM